MRWETINAYVDGELPPEEAEAVAERAARDPALRGRIATLSRLKAATTQALHHSAPARTAVPLPWGAWATAAFGAVLLLSSAGPMLDAFRSQDRAEIATDVYRSWLAGTEPATLSQSGTIEVGTWRGSPPDLQAAHLRLVFMVPEKNSGQGVLLGYEGPHGCRVGLWIGRSTPMMAASLGTGGDIQMVQWDVGGADFMLLAHGMDTVRLTMLAGAVEQLTRQRDPDEVRVALGHSARLGPPCIS